MGHFSSPLLVSKLRAKAHRLLPGIILASFVAMSAQFVAEHTGSPTMLLALLFGMVLNFVLDEPDNRFLSGVQYSAKTILKFGIVLLGMRIGFDMFADLGSALLLGLALAVFCTIMFGLFLGRILGQTSEFSILTAGSVSICGASAALAISSVLPEDKEAEKNLTYTILSVTVLSTIAMILYPVLFKALGLSDVQSGRLVGSTIHDVAQVVGAGFSISNETGEVATLVKLIRVSFLAPVVVVISLFFRAKCKAEVSGKKPPILPLFVIGFLVFACLNSFGFVSEPVSEIAINLSKMALVVAIAAVGIRTSLKEFLRHGSKGLILLISETAFLFVFMFSVVILSQAQV